MVVGAKTNQVPEWVTSWFPAPRGLQSQGSVPGAHRRATHSSEATFIPDHEYIIKTAAYAVCWRVQSITIPKGVKKADTEAMARFCADPGGRQLDRLQAEAKCHHPTSTATKNRGRLMAAPGSSFWLRMTQITRRSDSCDASPMHRRPATRGPSASAWQAQEQPSHCPTASRCRSWSWQDCPPGQCSGAPAGRSNS